MRYTYSGAEFETLYPEVFLQTPITKCKLQMMRITAQPDNWRITLRYAADPFDKQFLNQIIMEYLQTFANFKNWELLQSWHGIYPKMTNGQTELIIDVAPGVTIINGLGGNGMTLSFGLCEQYIAGKTGK